tara:strand:- start:8963 stop:9631 length:669 start_codon:yes stop_codon:yes gene_type:complete
MANLTNDQVRDALIKFMKNRGLNQTAFARGAGLSEATLRGFLKGKTKTTPRLETFSKLADSQGVSVEEMLGITPGSMGANTPAHFETQPISQQEPPVPIAGYTGPDGKYRLNHQAPRGTVKRIDPIVGVPDAFAAYVPDASMEPRYTRGDVVYINPSQPVNQGRHALLELADGGVLIGRVAVLDSAGNLTLQFYNYPQGTENKMFSIGEIAHIYRIVGTQEN